jgi:hypothetical protein
MFVLFLLLAAWLLIQHFKKVEFIATSHNYGTYITNCVL